MEDKTITWRAPEFVYHEKSPLWHLATVALAIIILAIALYTQNFLFAVFVVLAEALLLVWSREIPRELELTLSGEGISIGDTNFHRFEEMASFSVVDFRHGTELVLRRKGRLGQYIRIPLTIEHVDAVEVALLEKLPKKDYEDSLPDSLFHLIKF